MKKAFCLVSIVEELYTNYKHYKADFMLKTFVFSGGGRQPLFKRKNAFSMVFSLFLTKNSLFPFKFFRLRLKICKDYYNKINPFGKIFLIDFKNIVIFACNICWNSIYLNYKERRYYDF